MVLASQEDPMWLQSHGSGTFRINKSLKSRKNLSKSLWEMDTCPMVSGSQSSICAKVRSH